MSATIQIRRGSAAEWVAANPVLADGEQGFETDTHLHKVGDGVADWVNLEYAKTLVTAPPPSGKTRDFLDVQVTDARVNQLVAHKYGGGQGNSGYYAPTRIATIDGKRVLISLYSHPRELDATGAPVGTTQLAVTYAGMNATNQYMQYVWAAADNGSLIAMVSYTRHFVKFYDRDAWLSGAASNPVASIGVYNGAGHVSAGKLYNPRDIKALPNGNWLIASYNGNNDTGGQSNNQGYVSEWDSAGNLVAVRVVPQGTPVAGERVIVPKANYPSRLEFDPDNPNILYIQNHTFGITAIDMTTWSVITTHESVVNAPVALNAKGIGFRKIAAAKGGGFLVSANSPSRTVMRVNENFEYVWHVTGYMKDSYTGIGSSDPYTFYTIYDVDLLDDGSVLVVDTSQYAAKRLVPPDFAGDGIGNGDIGKSYVSLSIELKTVQGEPIDAADLLKWTPIDTGNMIFDWANGLMHVPTDRVFEDVIQSNNQYDLRLEL